MDNQAELERLRAEVRRLRAELRTAKATNDELTQRVSAEQASAVHFARQVQELRGSSSWRLTRPLRRLARRTR